MPPKKDLKKMAEPRDSLPRTMDEFNASNTSPKAAAQTVVNQSAEVTKTTSVSGNVSQTKTTRTATVETATVIKKEESVQKKENKIDTVVFPMPKHLPMSPDVQITELAEVPGYLSLKHLNTLLLRYIGVVHGMEEDTVTEEDGELNIDIEEKETSFLDVKYKEEIEVWRKELEKAKSRISSLEEEIKKLKKEVATLEESGKKFDASIKEKQKLIADKRMEISSLQASINQFLNQHEYFTALIARLQGQICFLTSELNTTTAAFQNEEVRGEDLGERLARLKGEIELKIKEMEEELTSEREKTTIEKTALDVRIKGEYISRLKVEVDILRGTYEEFMRVTREKLEEEHKDAVTKLELDLKLALSRQITVEDKAKIRAQVKDLAAKIKELEGSNKALSSEWSSLSVKLHHEEAEFLDEMARKEREIEHYSREAARVQERWEELNRRLLEERAEVQVYDRLLTPEFERMKARTPPPSPVTVKTSHTEATSKMSVKTN